MGPLTEGLVELSRRMVSPHWLVARYTVLCHGILDLTPVRYLKGASLSTALLTLGINPQRSPPIASTLARINYS